MSEELRELKKRAKEAQGRKYHRIYQDWDYTNTVTVYRSGLPVELGEDVYLTKEKWAALNELMAVGFWSDSGRWLYIPDSTDLSKLVSG